MANKAISTTVRACTMLRRRSSAPSGVWLNSSAISTVTVIPKTAWNTAGSAGSRTPGSRPTTRTNSAAAAAAMTTVGTKHTNRSKRP